MEHDIPIRDNEIGRS